MGVLENVKRRFNALILLISNFCVGVESIRSLRNLSHENQFYLHILTKSLEEIL